MKQPFKMVHIHISLSESLRTLYLLLWMIVDVVKEGNEIRRGGLVARSSDIKCKIPK